MEKSNVVLERKSNVLVVRKNEQLFQEEDKKREQQLVGLVLSKEQLLDVQVLRLDRLKLKDLLEKEVYSGR